MNRIDDIIINANLALALAGICLAFIALVVIL